MCCSATLSNDDLIEKITTLRGDVAIKRQILHRVVSNNESAAERLIGETINIAKEMEAIDWDSPTRSARMRRLEFRYSEARERLVKLMTEEEIATTVASA